MNGSGEWMQGERVADAATLHATDLPPGRGVWSMRPTVPALVLGSSQDAGDIDEGFCSSRGVQVVRRRSGGGAVLVHPVDSLWCDIVIPRHDPLWVDDVGRAMYFVGDAWRIVLESHGMSGLSVNHGPHAANDWSRHVCFAGRGSGEVFSRGADAGGESSPPKVVGISQRRTRHFARFQCIAYHSWDVAFHVGAIRVAATDPERVAGLAVPIPRIPPDVLCADLARVLSAA